MYKYLHLIYNVKCYITWFNELFDGLMAWPMNCFDWDILIITKR